MALRVTFSDPRGIPFRYRHLRQVIHMNRLQPYEPSPKTGKKGNRRSPPRRCC